MAAQELRWLTYLLTDLGEQPRLTLHGQLRLAYVATRANTADIFTEALPPGDHQRFSTVLGLLALLFLTGLLTTFAAAPPPLETAAVAPAPLAALVAPPLLCPAVAATTPAATAGTPAVPSPAVAATAPAASVMTPLLSPAAAATPHLLSPDAPTETAAAAAVASAVNPPLLSPDAPT
ncbi:unnamed protein product [Closterium sp. NIES-53]